MTPTIVNQGGNWLVYSDMQENLSGVNYVRITWNNTSGSVWNPELGRIVMT